MEACRPQNLNRILPGKGIEGVTLGMSQREVRAVMGDPEEVRKEAFPDDSDSVCLDYPTLGLAFDFGSTYNYVLETVRVEREDVQLFEERIFGNSSEDFLAFLSSKSGTPFTKPIDLLDEEGDRIVSYEVDALGLAVWFVNDALRTIQVSPLWEDECTPLFPHRH